MTDPGDSRPTRDASTRSWWVGGGFGGLRYEAGLDIRALRPVPPEPAAGLLRPASPADPDAPPGRTQLETWEWEGGAVGEQVRRRS